MGQTLLYKDIISKLDKKSAVFSFLEDVYKILNNQSIFFGDDKGRLSENKQYIITVSKENWNNIVKKFKPETKTADKATYTIAKYKIMFRITGKKNVESKQDANSTKQQELASAYVFECILANKGIELEKIKKIYPDCDDTWYQCFISQGECFKEICKKYKVTGSGYEIHRDGGFMDFISKQVKQKFKYASKDAWNPADVWLVKKSEYNDICKYIEKIEYIDQLNSYLISIFLSSKLIGISLKKTGKVAKWEVSNVEKKDREHSFVLDSSTFALSMDNKKGTFINAESAHYIKAHGIALKGQGRMFPLKPRQNIQFEIAGSVASARLGKVPRAGIVALMDKYGFSTPTWQQVPLTLEDFEKDKSKWLHMWKKIQDSDLNVDTKINANEFYDNMKEVYKSDQYTIESVVCSKLQNMIYVYAFASLNKIQRDELITEFVYLAKKEDGNAGPFIKIH